MFDSLDACAQAQIPRLGDARIRVAEDHDKDYQRRTKQNICGVAAWVTGAAKSTGISISIPTGLLIFVEEAPSSAREAAGSRAMRSLLS